MTHLLAAPLLVLLVATPADAEGKGNLLQRFAALLKTEKPLDHMRTQVQQDGRPISEQVPHLGFVRKLLAKLPQQHPAIHAALRAGNADHTLHVTSKGKRLGQVVFKGKTVGYRDARTGLEVAMTVSGSSANPTQLVVKTLRLYGQSETHGRVRLTVRKKRASTGDSAPSPASTQHRAKNGAPHSEIRDPFFQRLATMAAEGRAANELPGELHPLAKGREMGEFFKNLPANDRLRAALRKRLKHPQAKDCVIDGFRFSGARVRYSVGNLDVEMDLLAIKNPQTANRYGAMPQPTGARITARGRKGQTYTVSLAPNATDFSARVAISSQHNGETVLRAEPLLGTKGQARPVDRLELAAPATVEPKPVVVAEKKRDSAKTFSLDPEIGDAFFQRFAAKAAEGRPASELARSLNPLAKGRGNQDFFTNLPANERLRAAIKERTKGDPNRTIDGFRFFGTRVRYRVGNLDVELELRPIGNAATRKRYGAYPEPMSARITATGPKGKSYAISLAPQASDLSQRLTLEGTSKRQLFAGVERESAEVAYRYSLGGKDTRATHRKVSRELPEQPAARPLKKAPAWKHVSRDPWWKRNLQRWRTRHSR